MNRSESKVIIPKKLDYDEIIQETTKRTIFEEGQWFTAEQIDYFRKVQLAKSPPVSELKRRHCLFSIIYDRQEYYAAYQFDLLYQPLPIIKAILHAYGAYTSSWSLAAWFHFPNGWIADQGGNGMSPLSPKDCLDRYADIINAAYNRKGTYHA